MHMVPLRWLRLGLVALALAALVLPSPAADEAPADKAVITVTLPAKATLTIQDTPTNATGPERVFLTPPLEPGKRYSYELSVSWIENGKTFTVIKKVLVVAGKQVRVSFSTDEAKEVAPEAKEKAPAPKEAKNRTFQFTYAATVTGLEPEQKARVWIPVPPSNDDQTVKIVDDKGVPKGFKIGNDKEYGNQVLYVEAAANKDGKIPLSITYQVTRNEVKGAKMDDEGAPIQRFLQADKLVPLKGKPLDLIKGTELPKDTLAAARVMYDTVNGHMKYDKPKDKPWGRGDSVYACESGVGNCTDFHSLFISLARANKIPAKFEMGFPLPEKHGTGEIPGYHCWAKFKVGDKGWVPVDISEANKDPKMNDYYFGNLTEDRVVLTTGRDIVLEPKQEGEPLNYFIWPYVEVAGKKLDDKQVQRKISYKDLP